MDERYPRWSRVQDVQGHVGGGAIMVPGIVLLVLLVNLVPLPLAMAGEPCCEGDPSVGTSFGHQAIMLQGDDPNTISEEAADEVHVLHRTRWSIPWNSSEVYTYIDLRARNVTLDNVELVQHQGGGVFMPGPFSAARDPADPPTVGRVVEGPYAGTYRWRFPQGAVREENLTLVFATDEDLADFDPVLTNSSEWAVGNDTLALASNVTRAVYTSKLYTGGVDIVSVNLTRQGTENANMTFEVTGDNGTTWHAVQHGAGIEVPGLDGGFRWRVTMTQDPAHNATPVLDTAAFKVVFTPYTTDIWLEASYTLDVSGGGLEFDLQFPFDDDQSTFVLLGYFDLDHELVVDGTSVIADPGGTYPSKVTYLHMTGAYSPVITFQVVDTAGPGSEGSFPWLAISVPLVLVLIVILAYLLVGRRDDVTMEDVPVDEDGRVGASDDRGSEELDRLKERKSDLLAAIGRLDMAHEDGEVPDDEHEERRDKLKAETVEVMKRIEELEEGS